MKTVFISLAAAGLLTACASGPTGYGPAQGNGLGFATQKIQHDRFQVSFTGRNADEARNYALLRAAEVTRGEGYSHFRVVGSGTTGNENRRSPISSNIGVGIGSGGGRTHTNVGLGLGIYDVAQAMQGNKVRASLEIILERSAGANNGSVYDAQSIIDSMRPQVYSNP